MIAPKSNLRLGYSTYIFLGFTPHLIKYLTRCFPTQNANDGFSNASFLMVDLRKWSPMYV